MSQDSGKLECVRSGAVLEVKLNRPPLNVLNIAMLKEMETILRQAAENRELKLVVLRGKGKCFSAGVEVKEHLPDKAPEMLEVFRKAIVALLRLPVPSLCVMHGAALGGSFELALASSLAYATAGTNLGLPEIRLASLPPVAAVLLPYMVAQQRVNELLLTGRSFSPQEAARWGLINEVWDPPESAEGQLKDISRKLVSNSGVALRACLKARSLPPLDVIEASLLEAEKIYLEELLPSHDAQEGLKSFLEKRKPSWKER